MQAIPTILPILYGRAAKNCEWFNVPFCIVVYFTICSVHVHKHIHHVDWTFERRFLNEDRQLLLQMPYITINQTYWYSIYTTFYVYLYNTAQGFFLSLEAISKQNERINSNHTGIFARNFVLMIVISDVLILSVHQKHIALNHVNNFIFNSKIIVPSITASNHLDIALEIIANWNAYQVVRSIQRRINRSTERSNSVCCWVELNWVGPDDWTTAKTKLIGKMPTPFWFVRRT